MLERRQLAPQTDPGSRSRARRRRRPSWSPTSASTCPHGSMMQAWPKVTRLALWRPNCAAASTNARFSIARARSSGCQWSRPVCSVNAAGTVRMRAPSRDERAVELGEAQVVADGQADLADVAVDDDGLVAGLDRRRLAVDRAVGNGDVEQVDLAIDAADFAARVDVHRRVVHVRRRSTASGMPPSTRSTLPVARRSGASPTGSARRRAPPRRPPSLRSRARRGRRSSPADTISVAPIFAPHLR